jgi:hypothetical protein
MTAYGLLWELTKHVLHGRGRDVVVICVKLAEEGTIDGPEIASGEDVSFSWPGDPDTFCMLSSDQVIA